jgi:hypothetical protein
VEGTDFNVSYATRIIFLEEPMTDPTRGSADSEDFLSSISSHFSQWNREKPVVWVARSLSEPCSALTDHELERIKKIRQRLGSVQGSSPERLASDRALLELWGRFGKPEEWYWSLSHSAGWVLAVGGAQPIGVDLEPESRPLSLKALERLTTPEERVLGLPPVALWCLKEAAFKATPDNHGRVLSEFKLKKFNFSAGRAEVEDSKTSQLWEGRVALAAGYWIAIVRPAA